MATKTDDAKAKEKAAAVRRCNCGDLPRGKDGKLTKEGIALTKLAGEPFYSGHAITEGREVD